jgi:hypothetical protein
VDAHAAQFLTIWQPGVRLGRRTRWGAFSDVLDSAPWSAGGLAGDEDAGLATARVLLADASAPLVAGSLIYRDYDERGRRFTTRHRHTCCYAYRLPDQDACFSCPRTDDAERRRRAATWPDSGPPGD